MYIYMCMNIHTHTHTHRERERETYAILGRFKAESFSLKYNPMRFE